MLPIITRNLPEKGKKQHKSKEYIAEARLAGCVNVTTIVYKAL
jgi:hypothetical protein